MNVHGVFINASFSATQLLCHLNVRMQMAYTKSTSQTCTLLKLHQKAEYNNAEFTYLENEITKLPVP